MIALSEPNLSGNEWKYIKECLDTNWVSSVGKFVNEFEAAVARYCGAKYAVATSNGTTALHLGLLLAGVKPGELVLAPNITFVASINAIKYVQADPVLIDVDSSTWQMDLDLLEQFLKNECEQKNGRCFHTVSGRIVSAIMPVHVLGNIGDMDRLMKITHANNLKMVEDSTEALGSYFRGKHAGTFGEMGCLSFNGNKIITTGGGGMLITDDEGLAKKAKHLSTQAKADANEYYHDEVAYNYRLVNVLAAMGVAQMEQLPSFIKRKKEISSYYNNQFKLIPGICSQKIPESVDSNHWLYTIKVPRQKELRKFLRDKGVDARPFWVPMNRLPAFRENIYYTSNDVSSAVYNDCLSLPCSTHITNEQLETVAGLVNEFYHD
ncbi:MAG TPA: LegC family aminotransferase [Chitinophagaceae bacterium]